MTQQQYANKPIDIGPRIVPRPVATGGNPPNDGDMDAKIAALEATVKTLATKDEVQKGFGELRAEMQATRADIHKSMSDMKGWLIGVIITLFAAIAFNQYRTDASVQANLTAMRQSQAAPTQAQQPTIVVIPPQPAAPTPAPQTPQ